MPICAEVKCKYPVKASSRPLVRRLSRKSIKLFLENLSNILSCSKKAIEDLQSFLSVLIDLTNRFFPKKKQLVVSSLK